MTINQMREHILAAYPNAGQKFRSKVVDMRPNQVIAIYKSIQARKEREEIKASKNEEYHQMDIWEWLVIQNEQEHGPGTHSQILHVL